MDTPLETQLPRGRACGSIARRFLDDNLAGHVSCRLLDDLKLVASEMVDNAFVHGQGEIRLTVQPRGDRIRLEVIDEGEGAAVRIREHGRGLGGHGLRIIEQLSHAWGAYEGTTHVWAELTVSDGDGTPPGQPR